MPCNFCGDTNRKIVKGLCLACYYRQRNTGSLEYKHKGKPKPICAQGDCDGPAVSGGLCDKHYRRMRRHGHLGTTRPQDWGERTKHPLYKLWHGMHRRCYDSKYKDFVNYGARGIAVCERWHDFWLFVEDVGERPSKKHSIDRPDNDGAYSPHNFRWATAKEQGRNRRNSVLTESDAVEIKRRQRNGEMAGDIARSLGLDYNSVRNVMVGLSWSD